MNFKDIAIPSNKKFGYFFSGIFAISASYFLFFQDKIVGFILIFVALIFFVTTLLKAELLMPLNKFWAYFGICLGKITTPIILGFIFFVLFTPLAIYFRFIGRDALKIRTCESESYWIQNFDQLINTDFRRQF